MSAPPTESDVRLLRDRVFDQRSSDANWDGCSKRWMSAEGVAWLRAHDFPVERAARRKEPT